MKVNLKDIFNSGFRDQAIDTSIDISEIAIDSILENEFLKDQPIIKELRLAGKMLTSIRERGLMKRFLSFISEFHRGTCNPTKKATFQLRLRTEDSYSTRFNEFIVLLIDRLDSTFKSQLCANLLLAHINESFDWDHFRVLTNCVERMTVLSPNHLIKFSKMEWADYTNNREEFIMEERSDLINCGVAFSHGVQFHINQYGKDIFRYALINLK